MVQNVIVLGASGALGSVVLNALADSGFTVSALVRSSSKATFPPGIPVHRVDYDDLQALTAAFQGQDAVVSTITTAHVDAQRVAVDAAVAAKVQRFIPSEYGGDSSNPDRVDVGVFQSNKRRIVEYLESKEKDGLTWTAICTGSWLHWNLELDSAELGWDLPGRQVTIYDGGEPKVDLCTLEQVSRSIISTLRHLEETENEYVYVKSFSANQNELLPLVERLSGQKFKVHHCSSEERASTGMKELKEGKQESMYKVIAATAYGPWGIGQFGNKPDKWMKVLELPTDEDLEAAVRASLKRKGLV
ncbi:NmrA-like family protein [Aspergillus sclerotioniger CBS 115572]|uniref:NmrA-like family protein n=1 Tax=Aspergillus sclerotioniger CBS 115572 TaxID=1450535 RepID=A0A317W558_9EURO|nr:NmrA-like family protein [Aspergillus sclerotioniger CBS 115572]PWY81694.1 NmrA-like family protein [Aspergillus sclerotioniger CBS 115572]